MRKWISRKLVVAVGSIITLTLVKAGLPEESAAGLVDNIVTIVCWYLGAQGAVDALGVLKLK